LSCKGFTGDTASVSYRPYFGTAIKNLYDEAIAG
jgi:hypothetical protein